MDPASLEIHIALSLLPYLDVLDVCRARGVNKHWNNLFSSPDLLRSAIRIHGSASREFQLINRLEQEATESGGSSDALIPQLYQSLFRSFSIRTNNLRKGTPVQEIRFPLRKVASTGNFIYAIADDVLVYLSKEVGGLEVVFWNHDTSEYCNMMIDLGKNNQGPQPSAYSARKLAVFEDILVVEHTKEVRRENASGSMFVGLVQIFRLTSPFAKIAEGGEKVKASYEQLSLFETFKYRYVNYTEGIISDHSRTHYAAISVRSNSLGVGLFVWDIQTGKMVFRYEQEALGVRGVTRSPISASEKIIMIEDSHVMLVKPDIRNGIKWHKNEDDPTAFRLDILTFPLNVGEQDEAGVFHPQEEDYTQCHITRDKDDEMLQSFQDYIQWRVVRQRTPKLHHHDTPKLTTYLNLWGRLRIHRPGRDHLSGDDEEISRRPIERTEIHQYELTTSLADGEQPPIRAIYTAVNDRLPRGYPPPDPSIPKPFMSDISVGSDSPFFLNSNGTDALSFDMVWSGGSTECLGTRLMTFYFGIRSFQLTETSSAVLKKGGPLRYHLDYSSYLKLPGESGKVREIPSIQRNVLAMAQSHRGMVVAFDVHGDERMSIYTEPRKENNIADLVMCVWGSEELKHVEIVQSEPAEPIQVS
ncbi:hypothetical protein H072_1305 [Dactylellina haptotyla CBS 200.50]|uniref:F-box domain-containing protein n=1 Tax=Dactylellina haptotyla (strain CBS 200.50) TaxID=1284197 RepID=S8APB1_DACHA|nr:hypothetical protein H072_1305 [Dactylellina haptotyla CBS 200.50]